MKKFLLKTIGFISIIIISFLLIFFMADGSTDACYLKFTTGKQSALIIGSSRAAQGMHPKEFNAVLKRNDIYNYAFSLHDSPYGKAYFESIKRKIDSSTKNGIFILEVNPWTVGVLKEANEEYNSFREADNFIDNTIFVTLNPNIEYLIESYHKSYINILKDRNKIGLHETFFVENDGWLRVTIGTKGVSKDVRIKKKIEKYKKMLLNYQSNSEFRIKHLKKTINLLKQHGSVYMVRMPVINEILEIENELQSDFDEVMFKIAVDYELQYLNMMSKNNSYDYTDGNHLGISSGIHFSKNLAKIIKVLEN
ncbi:hypothetical protein [Formosa maritima]|uniref:SGNH/GDSL hydrolase family protein n=1 Tax=Formosa maritima TaxID=2592046 RepID=A0A5D0GCC1_9FLAO|nr:hypothetical protein [Formosa maritima]TYA56663.1 hypothetical protein FVF61_05865 [Formosa maritima]